MTEPDRDDPVPARPGLLLVGWTVGLASALIALVVAGHGALAAPPVSSVAGLRRWAGARPPEVELFALLRLLTTVLAAYLLLATVVATFARMSGVAGLVRLTDRVTLPLLRRLAAGAVASGLLPAPLAGARPAFAGPAGSAAVVRTARAGPGTAPVPPSEPPVMRRLGDGPPTPPAASPVAASPPTAPAAAPPPGGGPATWSVQPGESFWSIASTLLERSWGRPPSDAELLPYWDQLMAANDARLFVSGDPSLILPGQTFLVPPPPPTPGRGGR